MTKNLTENKVYDLYYDKKHLTLQDIVFDGKKTLLIQFIEEEYKPPHKIDYSLLDKLKLLRREGYSYVVILGDDKSGLIKKFATVRFTALNCQFGKVLGAEE